VKIVIDIGESSADASAVLWAMDGDGLELVGVDGSHVGCRIAGIVAPQFDALVPYVAPPLSCSVCGQPEHDEETTCSGPVRA
jgi:hypothetical protein